MGALNRGMRVVDVVVVTGDESGGYCGHARHFDTEMKL
jgi:hypothetical protein